MKTLISTILLVLISVTLFAQIDSANVLPHISLKEQFGIGKNTFGAALIANLLMIMGFYLPVAYNYTIKGKVLEAFSNVKQLIVMNIVMFVIATSVVLMPELSSLISNFGFVLDAESGKPAFVLLGFALYGAKLNGKLLKDNRNLQKIANEENVG